MTKKTTEPQEAPTTSSGEQVGEHPLVSSFLVKRWANGVKQCEYHEARDFENLIPWLNRAKEDGELISVYEMRCVIDWS